MDLIEFVILVGVLIWIGLRVGPADDKSKKGWKHTIVILSGFDDCEQIEHRLDEMGRWGRELVLVSVLPDGNAKQSIYAVFKEPAPHWQDEKIDATRARST